MGESAFRGSGLSSVCGSKQFKDLGPGVRTVVELVGGGRGGVGVGGGATIGCWLFSLLQSALSGAERSWALGERATPNRGPDIGFAHPKPFEFEVWGMRLPGEAKRSLGSHKLTPQISFLNACLKVVK